MKGRRAYLVERKTSTDGFWKAEESEEMKVSQVYFRGEGERERCLSRGPQREGWMKKQG